MPIRTAPIISFLAFITQDILLIHLQVVSILIVKVPHRTYLSKPQVLTYFLVIGFTIYIFNDNTDLLLVV